MEYLYLGEDADGISHFEDRRVAMEMGDFAPPAPAMWMSPHIASGRCLLLTLPVGWGGAKHPSPRRQIGFCLAGRLKVEAGDGEVRRFGAGAIWWMEDVSGSGHTTSVEGDEAVRLAILQID